MSGKTKTAILIFVFLFTFSPPVFASSFLVYLNEVAWMGDKNKTSNEWIELYNNGTNPISLDNWILKIDETEIKLKGIIPGLGFYLISRDKKLSANLFFNKALKNTGNYLGLFDANKNLIDEANWINGWPEGNNQTKQTMERKNNYLSGNDKTSWQTSEQTLGTPNQKNSLGAVLIIEKKENFENLNSSSLGPKDAKTTNVSNQTLFLGIIISLFSGLIILPLKNSLKNY